MERKSIGPSFYDELVQYGGLVGEHFSWGPDGTLEFFDDTPQAVIEGVQAVYAAHDPEQKSSTESKAQAQAELDRTDMVALRCWKAGVPFPSTWQKYTQALRAIIRVAPGEMPPPLPARPDYPAGT